MLTLPLEPTDDRANPEFKDVATCAEWLGQLQLTNLHQAHAVLRTQLSEFNRYPMDGLERLRTLELLRDTVSSIQADYARKLVGKKLPLSNEELIIFVAIVSLWQNMITGYQRCLQAYLEGDAPLGAYGALLSQRCLLYSGLRIFEYMRSGYEFDSALWSRFHQLYSFSEEQGWHHNEVEDHLNGALNITSCNATYSKTLLTCHAHRADVSRHQLNLLDRWLTVWGRSVVIEHKFVAIAGDVPPLAVDLNSTTGLQPSQMAAPSDGVRYLIMTSLSKLIRQKILLLQEGQSPQQLELGDDCNSPECSAFLNYLHQCWCEGRDGRMAERYSKTEPSHLCYGIDSCYAYIANTPFKQPVKDRTLDTLSRKQIAAFGHVLSENEPPNLAALGFILESWQIEDESIRGARLLRDNNVGERLGPGQFLAVRPTNATAYMVGAVSWVKVTQTGQLHIGVRYLPGLPQAVAMKSTGINLTVSDKYVAALLLPAVPALKTPASLIAPRDWFKPGRVVELALLDKTVIQLKMQLSIEKGSDYERISFTEV